MDSFQTQKQHELGMRIQKHYKTKDQHFDSFYDSLTLEYKLLKKLTHEC